MISKLIAKYKGLPVQMRASFWFLICAFLQKGISVITTPIFTRILTTAEYGQFSVFSSWLSLITVFVSLNLYFGVYTQGLVKFEEEKAEYSSSLQGLTFILVLGWTIVYLVFHDFWNNLFSLTTVQMLAMLVMIWTNAVFHFWSAEQRVNYNYRLLVIITLAVSFLKPFLGVVFVLLAEDKVTARILGLVLVELVFYSGFFFVQMKRGKKFFVGKFWVYALKFNIPLIPHYLSMNVLSSADRIMIGNMVGDSQAGIYQLAYSISQIMTIFNTALMQTIEPWLYRKIKEKRVEDISGIATPLFALIAGVNLAVIALAPEIIAFFAPTEYYDAIWIIPPVAMSVYFMFAYTFFAVFEFYYEKTKYIALATMVGALSNVVLNYIFIGLFGYYAAGYTTLLCYIIFAIFHYCFMRKLVKKNLDNVKVYDVRTLVILTISFMIAGFILLATYQNLVIRYALILLFFVVLAIKRKTILELIMKIINIKKVK